MSAFLPTMALSRPTWSNAVESDTGLILETTSDDVDAVLGACTDLEAVLIAEARLLLGSRE